jgi:hypothetical protein
VRVERAGHDAVHRAQRAQPVFRMDQFQHLPADHFLRRVAEDAFAGRTRVNEVALGIHDADRVHEHPQHMVEAGTDG